MRNKPYLIAKNKIRKPLELIHMDKVTSPDTSIYGNNYKLSNNTS